MFEYCIRCNEAIAVDDKGMCGHCHWAFRIELDDLWREIGTYLADWMNFRRWEEARS